MTRISASTAAPELGLLIAAAWLHEPLTTDMLAGSALILGAGVVATVPGRRTP